MEINVIVENVTEMDEIKKRTDFVFSSTFSVFGGVDMNPKPFGLATGVCPGKVEVG